MPTGSRGAIGRCRGCATILPLRWPGENEIAEEWVCTTCGQSYRGVRIQNLPRQYAKNIRPAGSGPQVVSASHVDAQVTAFLNPALVLDGQPHPITIAFPDRPAFTCDLETPLSRDLDSLASQPGVRTPPSLTAPLAADLRDVSDRPYDPTWVRRCVEQVVQDTATMTKQFGVVAEGRRAGLGAFRQIIDDQLRQILEDKDVFACLGTQPHQGDYPSRHALQVSMLAMSMGLALGWDAAALTDLGMGCLVHDAGMLSLDTAEYGKKGLLSARDHGEIAKHVVLGLDAFDRNEGQVSDRVWMVAYQIHERCNGAGYPRGSRLENIHPLARVAAVADVFVALISPRPHRPGLVPYHAIRKITADTEQGLFDKEAFRALLDTVSIFPIGSFVALNDGRVGRVIRPVPGRYDRPVVEVWHHGHVGENGLVLDLSQHTEAAIARSMAALVD